MFLASHIIYQDIILWTHSCYLSNLFHIIWISYVLYTQTNKKSINMKTVFILLFIKNNWSVTVSTLLEKSSETAIVSTHTALSTEISGRKLAGIR